MKHSEFRRLKQGFSEICRGYSEAEYRGKKVYFRHFGIKESYVVDVCFNKYFDLAIERGLPSEEQKLKELDASGQWKAEDELAIDNLRMYISNLNNTKSKMFKRREIDSIQKNIDSAEKELAHKLLARSSSLGMIAEHYANKKTNDAYTYHCAFSSEDLRQRFFGTEEEFDECEDHIVQDISMIYTTVLTYFSQETIKKICVAPFFQNIFYLAGENINSFFGKAITDLTYYQIDCLRYGAYFREILKDEDIPEKVMEDPEKLIEFHNRRKNAQGVMEASSNGEGVVSMVGVSSKELEELGVIEKGETVDLMEKARQSGGSLNMKDFLKLTGQ